MIGRIDFTLDGVMAVAEFDDSGRWSCPASPDLERALQLVWDATPDADKGPAAGWAARDHVVEMAALLGGTAELPELPPAPPGTIY